MRRRAIRRPPPTGGPGLHLPRFASGVTTSCCSRAILRPPGWVWLAARRLRWPLEALCDYLARQRANSPRTGVGGALEPGNELALTPGLRRPADVEIPAPMASAATRRRRQILTSGAARSGHPGIRRHRTWRHNGWGSRDTLRYRMKVRNRRGPDPSRRGTAPSSRSVSACCSIRCGTPAATPPPAPDVNRHRSLGSTQFPNPVEHPGFGLVGAPSPGIGELAHVILEAVVRR
jgi:hypothetical protein